MSLERSIMLKCRQAESSDFLGNGNYKTNLKKPVRLEEGDVVKIHTAILDTSTEGIVQVDSDIGTDGIETGEMAVSMTMAKYITHYQQIYDGNGTGAGNEIIQTFPAATPIDYQRQFACVGKGPPANTFIVNSIVIHPLNTGFDKYGDCQLDFAYVDPVTEQRVVRQKYFKGGHQISHINGIKLDIGWPCVCQLDGNGRPLANSFELVSSTTYLNSHKIDDSFRTPKQSEYGAAPLPGGDIVCAPYLETLTFSIKAGRYTPGEIATLLNDQMGLLNTSGLNIKNEPQNNDFPVRNPFLTTIRQIEHKLTQTPYGVGNSLRFFPQGRPDLPLVSNQITFDANRLAAGPDIANNPAGSGRDIIVGAEQASINYDDTLKKLNFDILHTPIYVGGTAGQNDAVPGIQFNNEGGVVNTFAGVVFTDLQPPEFWTNQLGFQDILCPYTVQTVPFNTIPPNAGQNVYPVVFSPVVGKHMTDVFDNMDLIVPKNNLFYNPSTPYVAPAGGAIIPGVQTSLTKGIIANREFDVGPQDEGYFLIEVGFKFPQSMIGGSVTNSKNASMNNIQSIVGKYYTGTNNFLQDSGSGSITYEHHGEPQLVSDLSIRILNPDGTVPSGTDIGPKNSIFIEVVKTLNIQPQQPPTK